MGIHKPRCISSHRIAEQVAQDDAAVHDVVGGQDDWVLHQSALHQNPPKTQAHMFRRNASGPMDTVCTLASEHG